jgi:Flp pilus assembly protein TadD
VWWRVAIIIVAGSLTYLNSVSNPFVFDDTATIVDNQQIRQLSDLPALLQPTRELSVAGRPVANISLALNYAVGGLNVAGYHIWNIAVHLLCALLLFGIIRRALELPDRRAEPGERSTNLAFAAALLWTVHPLVSEPVDYLTQRTESMMALFYLLTFYASIRALTSRRETAWNVAAVAACALGMGCKESMVTAPVMIAIFDRIFVFDSFGEAFRKRKWLYTALAATWLLLAALLSTGPRRRSAGFATGITPWAYLLNQPPLLIRYLSLFFWPNSLVANYGWPQALTLADVLPYAVLILLLLAFVVAALRWQPRLGFLGLWFFVTLAPTSSIVPIATEVGAERRMYLPLAALVVLVVVGVAWLWDRFEHKLPIALRSGARGPIAAAVLLVLLSTALGATTVARNREYSSSLTLARANLDRYPTPVAHHVLAVELLDAGDRQQAMDHLRQALPGAPRAHLTLGIELIKDRKLDEALAEMRAFVREQPQLAQVVDAHKYMGSIFARQERWPEAIAEFREALRISPSEPAAEQLLADALFSTGAFDEAAVHYRAFLEAEPRNVEVLNQLGASLASAGKLGDAIVVLRRAVEMDPKSGSVRRNLATALWATQAFDEAAINAREAVELQPGDAGSHDVLGRVLLKQGHVGEAATEFERSLQLDPAFADARDDLRQLQLPRKSGPPPTR